MVTSGGFSESELEGLKKVSLALFRACEERAKSPPGDVGLAQRQAAYAKMKEWANIAKGALIKAVTHFRRHRGEPIGERDILVLVNLLKQLRDDYIHNVIQESSELRRYDSAYQETAELDQEQQFWETWQPLFVLADSYREGASEKPPPGIGRVEFELKKREWSLEMLLKLDAFVMQFIGTLDALIELPEPP